MQEAVKTVINVLEQKGYKTYSAGIFALFDYNKNKGKYPNVPVSVVTECPMNILQDMFIGSVIVDNYINITFGNVDLFVYSSEIHAYIESQFVNALCIAEDGNNNFIFGQKFDVKNDNLTLLNIDKINTIEIVMGIIETISVIGGTLNKDYIRCFKNLFKYINVNNKLQIGESLKRILIHNYANEALNIMKRLGIFKSCLQSLNNMEFDILHNVNNYTYLDALILLYINIDVKNAEKELIDMRILNNYEIMFFKWTLLHLNIYDETDDMIIRQKIYNSTCVMDDEYKTIHILHKLVLKTNKIYKILYKKDNSKKILYNLACRPYFINQLNVKLPSYQQQKLLELLLKEKFYPIDKEAMDIYINNHGGDLNANNES